MATVVLSMSLPFRGFDQSVLPLSLVGMVVAGEAVPSLASAGLVQ